MLNKLKVDPRLPKAYLLLVFLGAVGQTFPSTAISYWLYNVIKISPSFASSYYAITFFPWCLKPFYAALSEMLPIYGYHWKSYLFICYLGTGAMYILMGILIETVEMALTVALSLAFFNAFSEFILGAFLVNLVAGDKEVAVSMQSSVAAVRNGIAPLIGLFLALPFFSCGEYQSFLSSEQIISIAAVFPLLQFLTTFFLLEPKLETSNKSMNALVSSWRFLAVVVLVQVFAAWGSIKDLVSYDDWMITLYVLISVFCIYLLSFFSKKGKIRAVSSSELSQNWDVISCALVLFVYNTVPTTTTQWSIYTYEVFRHSPCYNQWLSICSACIRLVGSVLYPLLSEFPIKTNIIITALISVTLSFLWLPLLGTEKESSPNVGGIPQVPYFFIISIIQSFVAQIAFVPLIVLATVSCPQNQQSFFYGIFISLMNIGDSSSGWVTSHIVKSFDITRDDWSGMKQFTFVCAGARVLSLIFVFCLPKKLGTKKSTDFIDDEENTNKTTPLLSANHEMIIDTPTKT